MLSKVLPFIFQNFTIIIFHDIHNNYLKYLLQV